MPINDKIMDMAGLSVKCTSVLNDSGTEMVGTSAGLNGVLGATTPAAATVTTLTATTVANTGINVPMVVRQSATLSATSGTTGTTLTNLTGMVVTVVPGTYVFKINLGTVSTANSGLKLAFKYTTAVLSAIEYDARMNDAAASVSSRGTTATDQASMLASTTAGVTAFIGGSMVVTTGGTVQLQFAQNASHADTTSVFLGSFMEFIRIA